MELTNQKQSFMPISLQPVQLVNLDLLESECKKIVVAGQSVDVSDVDKQFLSTPYFLRLFFSVYYTLANRTQSQRFPANETANSFSFFNSNIKNSLFKQIGTIIQKKLFTSSQFQKFYQEVSYSLAYKQCLLPYFISLLSQNTKFTAIQRLASFYRTICSEQYILYIPIQLYYLYGGSLFTIQSKLFKQKVTSLIQSLGRVLANSETLISRNIEQFKNNKERKLVLDESLKVVILSKNKESLVEIIESMTNNIFNGRQYLNKEQFLYQIQSKPLDPLLSIFILFLRSEYVMFEERVFQNALTIRSETSSSNFYTAEMNKLLNKCPFNGDDRCNCKKCQCVRRNRESAKLNQQKKRNAVEQVQVLNKRVNQLEGREKKFEKDIAELREENLMLKALLKQIRHNPYMKSIMMEAIQPINKVLNNEL